MTTYLINIGNTHMQIGYGENPGKTPQLLATYETDEIRRTGSIPCLDELPSPWNALASCVVPDAQRMISLKYGRSIRFLTKEDFPHLDFSGMDASTLGMDRIANAAAAHFLATGDTAVVIDFGTCINTIAVDASGKLLGGNILPGRMLIRKALRLYTAQLPLLPLEDTLPPLPGTNTSQAMAGGIDHGIIGAVRELLAETRRSIGNFQIFPTGGDAPFFLKYLKQLTAGPEYLTLRGILTAHI